MARLGGQARREAGRARGCTDGLVPHFVNGELLPYLRELRDRSDATARQRVISQVVSAVERVGVDTEKNLLDILDLVE